MDILDVCGLEDTYSMLGIMLYASSGNPEYSTFNELAYLLDNRSFVNLLKYYEGQTIKIPTMEETRKALRTLLLYQYYYVDGMDWNIALRKSGFSVDEGCKARVFVTKFKKELERKNYQTGGIQNVVKPNKDK